MYHPKSADQWPAMNAMAKRNACWAAASTSALPTENHQSQKYGFETLVIAPAR